MEAETWRAAWKSAQGKAGFLPPPRAGDIFPSHSIRQKVLASLYVGRGRAWERVGGRTQDRRIQGECTWESGGSPKPPPPFCSHDDDRQAKTSAKSRLAKSCCGNKKHLKLSSKQLRSITFAQASCPCGLYLLSLLEQSWSHRWMITTPKGKEGLRGSHSGH